MKHIIAACALTAIALCLAAGPASAGFFEDTETTDNFSGLGFGGLVQQLDPVVLCDAPPEDLEGFASSQGGFRAPNTEPVALILGLVTIDLEGDAVAALAYLTQEPNKVKRKDDKLVVEQDDQLNWALFTYLSRSNFEAGDIECQQSQFVLLRSDNECRAKGKIDDALSGKVKVKCKDVDSVGSAEVIVDEGGLSCDGPNLTQDEVRIILDGFLDESDDLSFDVKDDICTLTEVDELPGGLDF